MRNDDSKKKLSENTNSQKKRVPVLQSRASNPKWKWIRWLRTENFESSPCFEGVAYPTRHTVVHVSFISTFFQLPASQRVCFQREILSPVLLGRSSLRLYLLPEGVGQVIRRSPLQSPTFQWTRAQGSWSKSVLKGRAKTKTPQSTPAALVSLQHVQM